MTFFPNSSRRRLGLLVATATAVAASVLTVSAAAASPASAGTAASPAAAVAANPHWGGQQSQTGLASMISFESGCSASLARYPSSRPTDPAMMLTNGHCWEGGLLAPGQVLVDLPSTRSGDLLDANGRAVAKVRADRLLYATMTGTDVALYRLTKTFAHIKRATGLSPLTIAATHPVDGRAVSIPSGYWKIIYSCGLNGFVDTLFEGFWTWHDSIRYQYPDSGCQTIGGTSGSPIVDDTSRQIVGINNTFNEGGVDCTLNNPCEIASDGSASATKGQNYGQQTYWFNTCLTAANTIDLNKTGCLLTKP